MDFRGLGLLGVVLLSFACVVLAKDKEIRGPLGTSVKVLGHSGKILLMRRFNVTARGNESDKNDSKSMVKENKVVLIMDAISEVDKEGNIVGKRGKDKHSFNGFANQDFVFSEIVETMFQNLSVHQFNFTASNIGGTGGTLKVMIFLFGEDGDIDVGENETEEVRKGSLKFSIQITDWKFCGDKVECKQGKDNEVGAAIDFTITLQSKGGKKREGKQKCGKKGRRCGKSYDIGEGNMTLSNEVWVNGVWMEMEEGYPMFNVKGNKKSIVLRFPKGNMMLYDPTITMGDKVIEGSGEEPTDAPTTSAPTSGSHQVGLSITLVILATLSAFFHN